MNSTIKATAMAATAGKGPPWFRMAGLVPIAKRLLGVALILLAGSFIVFATLHAAPGDPALTALGESASPDVVKAFRAQYKLDQPMLVQYGHWLTSAVTGDMGESLVIARGRPIENLVMARLPATVFIGLFALVLAVGLSLVLGTVGALYRGKPADTVATSVAVLGISMPDFWVSYLLIYALALGAGWFPSYGFVSPGDDFLGALHSGFLPALAIAAPMAAVFSRTLRAALLESLHKPYVFTARSFGLKRSYVFLHFVFRNALIPYVTIIGLQIRYLLGGVVVIERIFGIPGIGSIMVDAAFGRDYPLVLACIVTFLVIVLAVNLIVDVICTALNPRARK